MPFRPAPFRTVTPSEGVVLSRYSSTPSGGVMAPQTKQFPLYRACISDTVVSCTLSLLRKESYFRVICSLLPKELMEGERC